MKQREDLGRIDLPCLQFYAPTYRPHGALTAVRRTSHADSSAEIHNGLVKDISLTCWGNLARHIPQKTIGLLFAREGKKAR
jgi:hypothetical protein